MGVLLTHLDELVDDCRGVLGDVTHTSLSGQQPLAVKALEAFATGHHEAAQALAVTVTETAVAHALGSKYSEVKQKVLFDPDLVRYTEMRLQAALAPIGPFYTTWYASSGTPAPVALSRHVTVHQADQTQPLRPASRCMSSNGGTVRAYEVQGRSHSVRPVRPHPRTIRTSCRFGVST